MTGPAMLARAAALRKSKLEAASRSSGETLFLYGSQTGNAMEVAKSLNAEAATHGIASRVLALDEKPLHKIPGTTKAAVFVVSSTGDGDPPENCERFHNALKRRTHAADLLAGVQFTVLGLGDSNYTTYMGVPRVFTSRLPELGAKRFYKNCEADEVDGLEDVIDKWKEGLWDALKAAVSEGANPPSVAPLPNGTANPPPASKESKLVGVPPLQKSRIKLIWQGAETIRTHGKLSSATNGTVTSLENGNPTIEYSAAHPFSAEVTAAEYMTASWSDRRVIHLEVDIARTGASYKPGDSLGVLPENRPELVDGLLERLGADGGRVFSVAAVDDVGTGQGDGSADVAGGARLLGHVGWPCTLREALLRHCDVTAVARKGLLRVLAEYCADSAERTELLMLSSRGGRDAYKVQIQEVRPSLLEILKRFPSCKPDLAHLLDSLPPLVARMYSVTCNANDAPGRVQVAFSVVKEQTGDGRVFHGVCTSWLERRLGLDPKTQRQFVANPSARVSVPVFLKSGGDFRLPEGLTAPLLMIGPGTGVAPFRGFLQQRRERLQAGGEAGPAWLFFGCRKEDEDFLYEKDLRKFETDGTLTKLVTAFSRAGDAKVYVQHKLSEHAEKLASLIQHGKAHVFICGDGVNMARDVHAALVKVLVDGAQMAEGDATALLNNMVKEKRYVRDIWS
ncbi:NADP/FAD dependent oxidoreductase [Klebsormidium nitens]|uniref:Methionine synthase reductase n=1 Tax=Klebsormidium nitens TaxID=105231 RepID=A0A0U9I7D5_KLENI|nr:NADP/FAD dependent oxidoreductase [Klebsormidium nitens]|eukprot:GAQ83041.1 NADP/FAD dependent oxidoreductase [Klebsormidium nitens]